MLTVHAKWRTLNSFCNLVGATLSQLFMTQKVLKLDLPSGRDRKTGCVSLCRKDRIWIWGVVIYYNYVYGVFFDVIRE